MLLHLPPIEGHKHSKTKTGPAITGAGAGAVRNAIADTIGTLPEQLRRSLTWDQGIEMAQHVQLRLDTGLQIYFCDPRSPWQRATTRTPTGCCASISPEAPDLARHSAEELAAVAAALNGRPRKTLGWRTPLRCSPNTSARRPDRRLQHPTRVNLPAAASLVPGGVRMLARGYRRSGPPSGRASTTTAASPRQTRSLPFNP